MIELLAVIVILGLLMAIAIPSVTKYITQSRKKTVSTTIDNYMSALTNQVNDMEYTFTGTNTIYAVPIECIALERGGTNPFGHWLHANNNYWAYVLVQYDDKTSSYTYGFTFKDSAGYGLYPTTSEKLKESGSQIQTDLSLNKPVTGNIINVTAKANWNGFDVDDNTQVHVLEATVDGQTGDGIDTCTLSQKGSNYEEVKNQNQVVNKVSTLAGTTWKFNEKVINYESLTTFDYNTQEGWEYFPGGAIVTNGNIRYNAWLLTSYDVFGIKVFNTVQSASVPYMFAYYSENSLGIEPGWYVNDGAVVLDFLNGNISDPNVIYDAIEKTIPPTIEFPSESNSTLENAELIDLMYENAVMQ